MKYLGIDYGEKNIGVSVSDENGTMAFPFKVLKNSKSVLPEIKKIITDENIDIIVLGESNALDGAPNKIMEAITDFKEKLQEETKKSIFLEPEFYTTRQSIHIQGKNSMIDASAATIILQSFLDRKKNS